MPKPEITVVIARSYVQSSMLFGLCAGAIVPVAILIFMANFGFNYFLCFGALCAAVVLAVVMTKTYRQALMQNIQMHSDKIVFDYITYNQSFPFASTSEWKFEKSGKNWCLTALKDGSSKLVPISAFPELQNELRSYYEHVA
jgi:hypothetical protein